MGAREGALSQARGARGAGSSIDRLLRVVGDVRAGEGASALALAGTLFVLLGAYYLLKVAREALLLSSFSAETKVYVAAVQAALLVPAVHTYGNLASRVGRVRLITGATLFFASNLALFAVAHAAGLEIGVPFFVWVGIFGVFVIAQLWTFANDVYSADQGQRLFAVIGLGSALGAIAGAYGAGPLGDWIGTRGLMLVPIALLLVTIVGVRWVHARQGGGDAPPVLAPSGKGALRWVAADRYLWLVAAMLLLLNLVNTIGEYVLDRVMQEQLSADIVASGGAARLEELLEGQIRSFKSVFFGAVNTLAFVLQLVVAGRVMKRGGAALAVVLLPVVALLGQAAVLVSGASLVAVAVAKVLENSVDYSVQNTGRNALFLVTPSEVKYRVKVFVDSVVMRAGDVLAGVSVSIGAGVLHLSPLAFVAVNSGITLLWFGVVMALRREHIRREHSRRSSTRS